MSEFVALNALKEESQRKQEKKENERGLLLDIPLQIVGGTRDAMQQVVDLVGIDKEFPEIAEADTTTGSLVRGGSQFLTGFIPAIKGAQAIGVGVKAAKFAKSLGLSDKMARGVGAAVSAESAAMLADQIVFDPHDARLSNLIEEVPQLRNPVTSYLASNPDDSEAEARFKVALEGAGLGALIAPMVPILSRMRAKRVVKNLDEAFEEAAKAEKATVKEATKEAAEKATPEDVLKESPQGDRPFVNNKYLDTPDEIKNTINSVTNIFEKTIDQARRGKVSIEETKRLADSLDMTVEELTKRRRGQAFNAEEALAARYLLNKSADNLTNLAKVAANPDTNSESAQLLFRQALASHGAIQEQVMGMAAEAGRALRQFQIPVGVPDKDKAIKNILEEFGSEVDPTKLADMVSKLDSPEAIAKFARLVHKPKFKDKVMELWINSLLSGPTTQAVNIMSNSLVALWTVPETLVAAGLGAFRKSDRVYAREAAQRMFGIAQGARDGVKLAYKTFLTEQPSDLLTKIETSKYQSIPSLVLREGAEKRVFGGVPIPFSGQVELGGKQIRIPGRLLQAGDEFFKSVGYRMELNAQAMRSGLDEGLKGRELAEHIRKIVDNPPRDIDLKAIEASRYQTFTNELGSIGKDIQSIAAKHPMARVVMPFIRTPVNIVKFAGHRSVFGYAMQSVKDDLKKGGAVADIAKARIYMGSAVAISVASMASDGLITGGGPKDPAQRAALYTSGWQPYSVRIGNKYYSYSRFEPLGMLLGVSADFAEIAQSSTEVEADEVGSMVVGSIAKNLTSKTWLRGLSELILAIEDPDRYGDDYVRKLLGTAVPTGIAQVARIEDPVMRQANTILEQVRSRVPVLSKDLYPVRNVWGEPIAFEGAFGPDIISPIYVSTINNDPLSLEVKRLGLSLQNPRRTIKGVDLTEDQYDRYVFWSGTIAKKIAMKYVTSPAWDGIPDYKKEEMIEDALTKGRKIARTRLMPELIGEIAKQKIKEVKGE